MDIALIKKIVHVEDNRFCGFLAPLEIITLIRFGARSDGGRFGTIEYAKKLVKQRNHNPYWFYFTLSDENQAELHKRLLEGEKNGNNSTKTT